MSRDTAGDYVYHYGLGIMGINTGCVANAAGLAERRRSQEEQRRLMYPKVRAPAAKSPPAASFGNVKKKDGGVGFTILLVIATMLIFAAVAS